MSRDAPNISSVLFLIPHLPWEPLQEYSPCVLMTDLDPEWSSLSFASRPIIYAHGVFVSLHANAVDLSHAD